MFRGVFSPVVTVFREDAIDWDAQGLLVERLLDAGVDGILFCGSIGEFQALSLEERASLFRWAVRKVKGRAKVLAGTGGTCVKEVVTLTHQAGEAGVDGAVVISPYYFKLEEPDLVRFYGAVASVGLPTLLYNFPDRTNTSLSADLVKRLAEAYPSIVGIKDTVDCISHTREVIAMVKPVRPGFSVLSGYDEYIVPNRLAGGDGILTGMTNVDPALFVRMWRALDRHDQLEVIRLQSRINRLMPLYGMGSPFVAAIKQAVSLLLPEVSATMRAPFTQVNEAQKADIAALLQDAGLLPMAGSSQTS